ncbi:hypothetical protein [Leptospira sp. GIMC2001]|uniref:hypothetical protein n=1 Tax=Leptospira sp. GIMC2001 TaxID=1513297 RepID=UPI00234997C1|nr:hypothetical protein [Leptospira sp. GIMC2001]WCL48722.1 hypothetical protein O4O04_15635 [Leptospira sp. GIMC2001]
MSKLLRMLNKFKIFLMIMMSGAYCASIDFIPEHDYQLANPEYKKTSWDEVEIYLSRPDKRINIQGLIKVKDFDGTGRFQDYHSYLKKEMFRKKMDGVWMDTIKFSSVDDAIFQTMDQRGNVTHSYAGESKIKVWQGYAFRNK